MCISLNTLTWYAYYPSAQNLYTLYASSRKRQPVVNLITDCNKTRLSPTSVAEFSLFISTLLFLWTLLVEVAPDALPADFNLAG